MVKPVITTAIATVAVAVILVAWLGHGAGEVKRPLAGQHIDHARPGLPYDDYRVCNYDANVGNYFLMIPAGNMCPSALWITPGPNGAEAGRRK